MTILKSLAGLAAVVTVTSLTGCASLTTGTHQNVSVKTGSVQGAICSLENSRGKWYVNGTPGSVVVSRSYGDLAVNCRKPGYQSAYESVKSHTKAMILGNAIIGGAIGAGVDAASGAAYDYPAEIDLPLKRA